jgi:hypothetical protein
MKQQKIYRYNKQAIEYLMSNNIEVTYCHKLNYHRYKVWVLMDSIDEYLDIDSFINRLKEVKDSLEYLYKFYNKDEKDYRSGFETYGYPNLGCILGNIYFLSSRWCCAFRIRWYLDLISYSSVNKIN